MALAALEEEGEEGRGHSLEPDVAQKPKIEDIYIKKSSKTKKYCGDNKMPTK